VGKKDAVATIGQNVRRGDLRASEVPEDLPRHHHRDEHFDVVTDDRAVERRVGHAHDRQRGGVDLDRLPDDVRIGTELAPPESIAEHDDGMAAGRDFVRRQQRAAARGAYPEDLKVVPGDELPEDLAGATASAQVDLDERGSHEPRERTIVIADVLIVGIRHAKMAPGTRFAVDDMEPGRPVDARERGQREALDHREDGGVEPDAQRQDADNGEREGRVLGEGADRVPNVAHQIAQGLEPPRGPDAPGSLGRQRDVAEILQRRRVRRLPIGAVGHALVFGDRQVRTDLVLEVLFIEAPSSQRLEPATHRHHATPRFQVPASSPG
jgi:hypothetical protein